MRKAIRTLVVLGIEAVGSVVLEETIIPTLFNPPWLFVLFGALMASAVALWVPEIKQWMDPAERIIRRGQSQDRKKRHAHLKRRIQAARKTGLLTNVTYDPAAGRIGGDLIRRSWKSRWVGYGVWLANHRILPARIFIWLVKRLGYTIKRMKG